MTTTVAFFNGYYLPHMGGVERYTHNIAQQLHSRGYRVIVITTQHDSSLPYREEAQGITVYRLPIFRLWKSRYPFLKRNHVYRSLIAQLRSEPIDFWVVNTRFYQTSLLGSRLAAERGHEAIVIEHGSSYLTLGNPIIDVILNQIERILIKRVKATTTYFYGVSQESANWLTEFDIHARGVLFNAISRTDFDHFTGRSHRDRTKNAAKIVISYTGRFIPKIKGIETLLSVFTQIDKKHNNLELYLAGDGPLLEPMKKKYTESNIHFLGLLNHDEVMQLESRSDIFVLLSRSEGFSTAMLEAGLLKNAIITTPTVGGARALMPDESYGYIIENDEAALKKTLDSLIQNPTRLNDAKEKVSQRVLDHFTWEKTTDAFEKVFKEMRMRTMQ